MYQIAVDYPGMTLLSYLKTHNQNFKTGDLVYVPLGKRKAQGCVIDSISAPKDEKTNYKMIEGLCDSHFQIGAKDLELYQWISRYYHYPLGQIIFDTLPKSLKRPRIIKWEEGLGESLDFELNPLQKEISEDIKKHADHFHKFFIHGVTGSGKSGIYIELMKNKLNEGKSVLFLVPEINLTPALINLFKKTLPGPVICYHSNISASLKYQIWNDLNKFDRPITILGVRSSIYLPIKNLGLIVVDEEHDQSFKQNDRCPYNGRDVAIKKAQILNIPIIMGSATPSVENFFSFYQNKKNAYSSSYILKDRAQGHFPKIQIVDVRKDKKIKNAHWPMSQTSLDELSEVLKSGEKAIIFVNRLGFAQFLQCSSCGYKFCDPGSDIPLRYFKNKNILSSTQSDYKIPMPDWCPQCGNLELWQQGFGTEKVQEVLKDYFKDAIIERFDRDEIKNFDKMEQRLDHFINGKIDILVGTQMLAKGHNFPKVNLVIILGIDSQLNYPDFRSSEKVYQLLTQVSGRAGRFNDALKSKVIIQTLSPGAEIFEDVKGENFDHFYYKEMEVRKMLSLPPYSRQAAIFLTSGNKERLVEKSNLYAKQILLWCEKNQLAIKILGPVPLMMEKRQNKFTWCILLQTDNTAHLHLTCDMAVHNRPKGIITKLDVDPGQIL